MTPRGPSGPSSSPSRRPRPDAALAALLLSVACATATLPQPGVAERARAAVSWSGSVRVSVKGQDVRGRSRVLMAFRRPEAVRIEIPGPAGARLVAVVRDGRLTAVLPSERAFLESAAGAADLEALLGVAPAGLRDYRAQWGEALPRRVEAVLADGTHLKATVDDAETGLDLPDSVFEPPPHEGHRRVDAAEARRLLTGGRP